MSSPTVKAKPIPPPDPGVLLPGATGDISTGKLRRQIEVPQTALMAPLEALQGASSIARDAGQVDRAKRLQEVAERLSGARAELSGALAALDKLERAERS